MSLIYSNNNKIAYKDGKSGIFYYEYKNSKLTIVIEKSGEKHDCLLPNTLINIANKPVGEKPIFIIRETEDLKTYCLKMKIGEAEYISGDTEGIYVDIAKVLVNYGMINVVIKYTPSEMPKVLKDNEMGIGKAHLFDLFNDFLRNVGKNPSQYSNSDFGEFNVDGLKIFVSMGRISEIRTETDQFSTTRGLKISDSKEKAVELYGLPDSGYYEDEDWVYYLKRNWNGEGDYYISSDDSFNLRFKNGKLEWMYFSGYIPAD